MIAVGVSVAFGFIATVLELLFPGRILPALFQLVGSTCLVVWGSALVSQLILRRRADRDGTHLALRMKGFPDLQCSASCCSGWFLRWASAPKAAASSWSARCCSSPASPPPAGRGPVRGIPAGPVPHRASGFRATPPSQVAAQGVPGGREPLRCRPVRKPWIGPFRRQVEWCPSTADRRRSSPGEPCT